MLSNIMLKLPSCGSVSLRYMRRINFGIRQFIICQEMSFGNFLKFCKLSPSTEIRLIAQQDLDLLKANLPSAPYREHRDDLADQNAGIVSMAIAWLAGLPIGKGLIHWSGPRNPIPLEKLGPIPEIFHLYVRRELRSLGIGMHLVQFLEHLARSRGHASIGLGVSLNNTKARTFYERIGYTGSGTVYIEAWSYPGKYGEPVQVREESEFLVKNLT